MTVMTTPSDGLADRLSIMRDFAREQAKPLGGGHPPFVVFLSVSDGKSRARVFNGAGSDLDSAWRAAEAGMATFLEDSQKPALWIKADWVTTSLRTNWAQVTDLMKRTKRNYFRRGLAFDADFSVAFLEQELNGNAMLYGGNSLPHAVLNPANFALYAKARYGQATELSFDPETPLHLFATEAVFCDGTGALQTINASGPNGGRRQLDVLTAPDVTGLIERSSGFLAEQIGDDGRFVYGYHPCFDRKIEAYNTLRHASTTYAMIEAWEVTGDAGLQAAIERSLAYLVAELIKPVTLPDGTEAAYLVDTGNEIKLGGNAVAILALAKYSAVTGTRHYLPIAEALGHGIAAMQDKATGAFVHVLTYPDLSVKADYRTIYYDGEAAFGLMRLYEQTQNPLWLEIVERAFEHFIAAEHWRHHDHWLSYCVNELTRYRPEARYFRFGIQNFADYLDFVVERITTFPTLLELMMAAEHMITRLSEHKELAHLLDEVDLDKFHFALNKRAHHLLNGHFWPELAMYFRNPARIVGSFFIRHHAFRVRIDDVEHYLSGFVAYRRYLLARSDGETVEAGLGEAKHIPQLAGIAHAVERELV